tara:strand:+ start:78 stop:1859 length:1782 start_codon:yes stop_codon:yes gene_type:complete
MAEENANVTSALAVVEEQQKVVGSALVAASGTAVLAENSDTSTEILEQIRFIQNQTLRAVRDVANGIMEMVAFNKLQDRRALEDKTEDEKENQLDGGPGAMPVKLEPQEGDEGGGGSGIFASILGAFGGMAFLKKLFAPFIAIFGKSGMLVKLFGRFGPLGALILGFTLVYKYSDEIAKALTPALDKLKDLATKLKPVTDFLIRVGDFLIKSLLGAVGGALELVVDAVTGIVEGFTMIFEGDVLGGLNRIFGMEGLLGFLIELPKKIFDKTVEFLGGLAEAMGIDFKALYDNIVLYVTDTITNIKNFFIDLKDNIVQFFTDAYDTVKTTITDAINGAFTFFADIFNSISDFFSDSFNKVKDFVTSLPDKILGFVSNMFRPITDFFTSIGNRIKEAINGIVDALPLPDFVKDKMKFNVTPTQSQLDEVSTGDASVAEKIALDEAKGLTTIAGKYDFKDGVLQQNGQDFRAIGVDFAEAVADEIGEQVKVAYDKTNKRYVVVKQDMALGERTGTTIASPDVDMTDIIGTGNTTNVKLPVGDIPDLENDNQGAVVVNNNNYNTSNSSVNSQTDVHSGKLDTGIDPYFEKSANNLSA